MWVTAGFNGDCYTSGFHKFQLGTTLALVEWIELATKPVWTIFYPVLTSPYIP